MLSDIKLEILLIKTQGQEAQVLFNIIKIYKQNNVRHMTRKLFT